MSKSFKNDLTGQRFGRLTVLEFVPTKHKDVYWKCQCDCGKSKIIMGTNLKSGKTNSCGCIRKELSCRHKKSNNKIYKVWTSMKQRCYNSNNPNYKNYGGRGIRVYDEWKDDFKAFYDWAIKNGYSEELTLDRIDNNGNYEPCNCSWVSMKKQQRNKRSNIMIEYEGKRMCLAEVARLMGISYRTLCNRYHKGDRGERLFRPVRKKN